jgi:predicted nucleotidyltransferase component of viral defense system
MTLHLKTALPLAVAALLLGCSSSDVPVGATPQEKFAHAMDLYESEDYFEAEYLININKDIRTIESNYSLSEVLIDFTFWSGPLLTHYHQPTPPMVINELSPYLELLDDHQRRPDYIFIHKYDFRPVPPRKYDIYSIQGNLLKNILLKYRIVKTSPYYDIVALKNSHFTEIKFDN